MALDAGRAREGEQDRLASGSYRLHDAVALLEHACACGSIALVSKFKAKIMTLDERPR